MTRLIRRDWWLKIRLCTSVCVFSVLSSKSRPHSFGCNQHCNLFFYSLTRNEPLSKEMSILCNLMHNAQEQRNTSKLPMCQVHKKPMTQVCCKQATKIWTISRWKFPSMQMAFSSRPHYHIFYDLYFSVWKDLEEDLLVAKWEGHYSVLHGMGELWADILRCPVRRTK